MPTGDSQCRVARGKEVLGRLGVTPSTTIVSPMPPSCSEAPHSPTHPPTLEPGGCGEDQAPSRHHFLLSFWCRAEAWPGGGGCPPGPPGETGKGSGCCWGGRGGRDRTWGSGASLGVSTKPDSGGEWDGSGCPCLARGWGVGGLNWHHPCTPPSPPRGFSPHLRRSPPAQQRGTGTVAEGHCRAGSPPGTDRKGVSLPRVPQEEFAPQLWP